MSILPDKFVYLSDIDPSIVFDIKYATSDNILGRPVAGYSANICICSLALAQALAQVQQELQNQNLSLLVYETFRPQRASLDIKHWVHDLTDQINKAKYYPNVDKSRFYSEHYFIEYSAHTRGAAADITIIDAVNGLPWDMGTPFDFMDELSHPANRNINPQAYANRQFLRKLMQSYGFEGIQSEWWHFNLKNEPFPTTYFDFDIH